MNLENNIHNAIFAHGKWKARLQQAINDGKSDIDVPTAEKKDACEFGKWLYQDTEVKKLPHYDDVESLHAEFHLHAAKILKLALDGEKGRAEKGMEFGSNYATSSTQLMNKLGQWIMKK
jgi:hypothetical protein